MQVFVGAVDLTATFFLVSNTVDRQFADAARRGILRRFKILVN